MRACVCVCVFVCLFVVRSRSIRPQRSGKRIMDTGTLFFVEGTMLQLDTPPRIEPSCGVFAARNVRKRKVEIIATLIWRGDKQNREQRTSNGNRRMNKKERMKRG